MSMPDHRTHSFRILAIVAAVGLMVGFWLLRDAAGSRSVVLSNMSKISVVDVTLAPTNVLFLHGQWDKLAQRFFPKGVRIGPIKSTPGMGVSYFRSDEQRKVYFWLRHKQGTNAPVPFSQIRGLNAAIADDQGDEWRSFEPIEEMWRPFRRPTRITRGGPRPAPPRAIVPGDDQDDNFSIFAFRHAPLRSKWFRLRLYSEERGKRDRLLAEFKLRNPAFATFPVWTPEPLPTTKGGTALAVELTTLDRITKTNASLMSRNRFVTTAVFRSSGSEAPDRVFTGMEFSDAPGNSEWLGTQFKDSISEDSTTIESPSELSPSEVWNLRMRFTRRTGFSAENILSPLVLPIKGMLVATNFDINFGSSHLHVKTMEDTVHVTNLDTKNPPWFKVISIIDNHGQPVARTGGTWDYGTSLTIRVTVPENADYITLALARTDHRFVEFRVKPTLRDGP